MHNDLIERYVYAVTKRLPYRQRADIEKELRSLIADMLEQRCADMPPAEKDVRVVLTELGTPEELAEKYDPDKRGALIGPPYYRKYKFVLKIVLAAVGGSMLLSGFITALLDGGNGYPIYRLFSWLGMVFMGEIYAFAFVTALFAFFERRGAKFDKDNSLSDLPPVPKKNERIDRHDPVIGIVLSTLFLVVLLWGAPHIVGIYNGNTFIPMFDQAALQGQWLPVVGIFAFGVCKEIFRLNEGRYTLRLALATLLLDICSLALLALLFSATGLINPAFAAEIHAMFGNDGAFIAGMFVRFPVFFFCVMVFAVLLDIVTSFTRIGRPAKSEV